VPEEKKKQAQFQKIEVPIGLSVDSPMVIFHTDLETLGLTGGGGTPPGGGDPAGGGTPPSSGGDTPPPTSQAEYIAMCDRVQHAAGDGVVDGKWFGVDSTNFDDALASALAHEDGLAFVAIYVNGVLVGPVMQP
jgi:hypothetical protein